MRVLITIYAESGNQVKSTENMSPLIPSESQ